MDNDNVVFSLFKKYLEKCARFKSSSPWDDSMIVKVTHGQSPSLQNHSIQQTSSEQRWWTMPFTLSVSPSCTSLQFAPPIRQRHFLLAAQKHWPGDTRCNGDRGGHGESCKRNIWNLEIERVKLVVFNILQQHLAWKLILLSADLGWTPVPADPRRFHVCCPRNLIMVPQHGSHPNFQKTPCGCCKAPRSVPRSPGILEAVKRRPTQEIENPPSIIAWNSKGSAIETTWSQTTATGWCVMMSQYNQYPQTLELVVSRIGLPWTVPVAPRSLYSSSWTSWSAKYGTLPPQKSQLSNS